MGIYGTSGGRIKILFFILKQNNPDKAQKY